MRFLCFLHARDDAWCLLLYWIVLAGGREGSKERQTISECTLRNTLIKTNKEKNSNWQMIVRDGIYSFA